MRKLKAYLRPSLTTFCRNLFERLEEKRRRIRAGDSFQFSAQLTVILRRSIHLTDPRTMSSKNPENLLLAAQRKSLVLSWTQQRKQTASFSGHRRRRSLSFFKFWIRWPQSSCASKNCVVVFIQHLGLRAREYQSSDPLMSSTAPVFTGAN